MAHVTSTTNRHTGTTRRPAAPLAGRACFGTRGSGRGRRAFTLIEALMASAVLAIAVIAIGTSLSTSVGQSAVVEQDSTSLLLARQLMEEIAAKPFVDPTTGTVTTNATALANAAALAATAGSSPTPVRASYNDVGDYHGYTDTVDASHPATSLQGKTAAVTNNRKYTRSVTVEFRSTPNGSAVTSGDLAVITVTVKSPSGRSVVITRVATNTTLLQSY
jgi:Tfp pilus assembly protein PilV